MQCALRRVRRRAMMCADVAHAPTVRRLSGRRSPPLFVFAGRRRVNVGPNLVRLDVSSGSHAEHLDCGDDAPVLPAVDGRDVLTDGPRKGAGRSEKSVKLFGGHLHERSYCRSQHTASSPFVAFCMGRSRLRKPLLHFTIFRLTPDDAICNTVAITGPPRSRMERRHMQFKITNPFAGAVQFAAEAA